MFYKNYLLNLSFANLRDAIRIDLYAYNISMKWAFLKEKYNFVCMSLYWNNKLLKKLSNNTKRKFKCRINTDVGRFYFYFEENKKSEQPSISGRLVFFPKNHE